MTSNPECKYTLIAFTDEEKELLTRLMDYHIKILNEVRKEENHHCLTDFCLTKATTLRSKLQ